MKDFFISIFKTSEERIKNPFVGTFILSFIVFNWKAILIIVFSSYRIEDRVSYVSDNYSDMYYLLVMPLLISIFYTVGLPYLMLLIEKYTFYAFEKRSDHIYSVKKVDIEGKISVSDKEMELEDKRANYKEKSDLNNQIKTLKESIEEKDRSISHLEERCLEYDKEYKILNDKILNDKKYIDAINMANRENNLIEKSYLTAYNNLPENVIESFVDNFIVLNDQESIRHIEKNGFIEKFTALGLIEKDKNGIYDHFKITDKGLFFIKQANNDNLI
jgi:hypothetical protein